MDTTARLTALRLVEELAVQGFRMDASRREDVFRVWPQGRLTNDQRARIMDAKPALVELLDPPAPDGPCPDCGGVNYVRRPLGRWRCLACWPLTADVAAGFFFGPVAWHRGGGA